jgi:hypothetical protein
MTEIQLPLPCSKVWHSLVVKDGRVCLKCDFLERGDIDYFPGNQLWSYVSPDYKELWGRLISDALYHILELDW